VYQILSELTEFCGRYDKNILVCFSVHGVDLNLSAKSLVKSQITIIIKFKSFKNLKVRLTS